MFAGKKMINKVTLCLALSVVSACRLRAGEEEALRDARRAFEISDYQQAVRTLQEAAKKAPDDPEVHFWLARSHYELRQLDPAITHAERAVALDSKNSLYHEWLGRSYGDKADHSSWFSAVSLAKKTRQEFETAVRLDERNFSARQALVEFDCSAPGIVGGGEDKARPEIAQIAALDAAEGHYAAGNCRRQKKDFDSAGEEFAKALASSPKSVDLIFDIGDYAMKRSEAERLEAVANAGEKVSPRDVRSKFYRAVALILRNQQPAQAEKLLRDYMKVAPTRTAYPRPVWTHFWLGRLLENRNDTSGAAKEYQAALKLDPKNKMAQESLQRVRNN